MMRQDNSRARIAVLLICVLLPLLFYSSAQAETTLQDALDWLTSRLGQAVDADGIYGVQCGDLATAYLNYIVGSNPNTAYGTVFTTKYGREYYDYISQIKPDWERIAYYDGFVPEAGDIICFSPSVGYKYSTGHVAIVVSGNTTDNASLIQEDGVNQSRNVHTFTMGYTGCQGVIRPKYAADSAALPPQTPHIIPLTEYPACEAQYSATLAAYYRDAASGELEWLASGARRMEDYTYAFCDIDGNGVPELVKNAFGVFEVYTLVDGSPRLIAEGGYRSGDIEIGESGLLRQWGSDSASGGGGDYWRISDDGYSKTWVWRIVYKGEIEGYATTRYFITDARGHENIYDENGFKQWGADNFSGLSGYWPGEETINSRLNYKAIIDIF